MAVKNKLAGQAAKEDELTQEQKDIKASATGTGVEKAPEDVKVTNEDHTDEVEAQKGQNVQSPTRDVTEEANFVQDETVKAEAQNAPVAQKAEGGMIYGPAGKTAQQVYDDINYALYMQTGTGFLGDGDRNVGDPAKDGPVATRFRVIVERID